jgi:hypothetical protein
MDLTLAGRLGSAVVTAAALGGHDPLAPPNVRR